MHENEISYIIRGAIYKVYTSLGPGLLESVYAAALAYELRKQGVKVSQEVAVPVYYDGVRMKEVGFRLDLLVDEKVIIELKSIESLLKVHHKVVLTYLRITGHKLAILVNFAVDDIKDGIFRKVNGL